MSLVWANCGAVTNQTNATGTWQQLILNETVASSSCAWDGPWVHSQTTQTFYVDDASLKQQTAPSATGVTITSASGGSTYNWASEDPNFNPEDYGGWTYNISGTGIYTAHITDYAPYEVFEDTIPLPIPASTTPDAPPGAASFH